MFAVQRANCVTWCEIQTRIPNAFSQFSNWKIHKETFVVIYLQAMGLVIVSETATSHNVLKVITIA